MRLLYLAVLLAACGGDFVPQMGTPVVDMAMVKSNHDMVVAQPDMDTALSIFDADMTAAPADMTPPSDMTICGLAGQDCCAGYWCDVNADPDLKCLGWGGGIALGGQEKCIKRTTQCGGYHTDPCQAYGVIDWCQRNYENTGWMSGFPCH